MRLLAASILICLAVSAHLAFTPAYRESCSCSAGDNTCAANVDCNGSCMAWCPSGSCRAMCIPDGGGGGHADLMMSTTLRLSGADSAAVSAELARLTGREVVFNPSTPGDTFNLDVKDTPLWNVLETLSRSGRLQIAGEDFSNLQAVRRALLQGDRISVCIHGVTVKRLAEEITHLTGLEVSIGPGNPRTRINLTAKGINLTEIVARVSEQTSVPLSLK